MTREERCKLAIERGYTYDPESGLIFNRFKRLVNCKLKGYIYINIGVYENKIKKCYHIKGHHLAWYWVYENCDFEQLDHINRNRNDNRINNLRKVNNQQNQRNRNVKGYHFCSRQMKYVAQITVNVGKKKHLGYFNTKEEAIKAYTEAKKQYHKF